MRDRHSKSPVGEYLQRRWDQDPAVFFTVGSTPIAHNETPDEWVLRIHQEAAEKGETFDDQTNAYLEEVKDRLRRRRESKAESTPRTWRELKRKLSRELPKR